MKPYLYTLLAAAAATGLAQAQTAYTTPVGYVTQSLAVGFNAAGLTLQNAPVATGDFESAVGNVLSDSDVTYAPVEGRTYALEITSGVLAGAVSEVPAGSISGSAITTVEDFQALGVVAGDTYKLRLCPTLEDVFTLNDVSAGGVLKRALSSGSADIVWLPDGLGGFTKYYLRSGTSPEFRDVATNLAAPNTPIVYPDGILIEKKSADVASLTITGEVKPQGTNSSITFGYNLVNIVAPVGLNLFNAGLEDNLQAALSAGSADEVWVQEPGGAFVKYFRRSGAGAGWRVSGTTTTLTDLEAQAVILPNSILIHKKAAGTVPLTLNVPDSYPGL